MSYLLRNVSYRSSIPHIPTSNFDLDKAYEESKGFSVLRPIPYSIELEYNLIKLSKLNFPHFNLDNIPSNYSLDIRTGIARTWISLRAYFESKRPLMGIHAVELAFEKNGAKTLKRIRWKSLHKTFWNSSFVEEPEWWNYPEVLEYNLRDIGDIFYYKYSFPWEEPCEDYKFAFLPLKQKKSALIKFRSILEDLVSDWNFDVPFEKEEILYQMSTSKTLLKNGKTDYLFLNKDSKTLKFSKKRSPGLRCCVYVHPEGVRDTIINKSEDLYTIKAIDYIVQELLYKNVPEYLVDKDTNAFVKRYQEMYHDNSFVYCRDITKEGITKPRNLLTIMLEVLKEKCPSLQFVNPTFYESEWLSFDGKTPAGTKRGHGLGMANSLTTLMQIVIFNYILRKFYKKEYTFVEIKPLFLNDDCIFFFKEKDETIDFFEEYDELILNNLGLIRNQTKSFAARGGVFCENYLPELLDVKESFKRRECLLPLTATNITHAKSMFTLINLEYMDYYFMEIIHKFGYEFFPEEKDFSADFGGWIPYKTNRLNTDLLRLEHIYEAKYCRAFFASTEKSFLVSRKKLKDLSINNFLPINIKNIDEEILKNLNIIDKSQLLRKFYIPFYDQNSDIEWKKLYRRRQKVFQNSPIFSFRELCQYILKNYSNYAPPEFAVERRIKVDLYENLYFNYYDYKFPICAAIRALNKTNDDRYPSSLWPLMKGSDEDYSKASVIRKMLGTLCLENFINIYDKEYNEGNYLPQNQEDLDDLESSYVRPFDITYFYGKLDRLAPILLKEYRANVDDRKTFFGSNLKLFEIYKLNNLSYRIIKFIKKRNYSSDQLDIFLEEYHKELHKKYVESYEFPIVDESEDDFDYTTLTKKKERSYEEYESQIFYKDPTEEELHSYMLNDIFLNNVNIMYTNEFRVKTPLRRAIYCFIQRNILASNLEEIMLIRDQLNEEIKTILVDNYPDIYDFLFVPKDTNEGDKIDEEVDFVGDFDMFG